MDIISIRSYDTENSQMIYVNYRDNDGNQQILSVTYTDEVQDITDEFIDGNIGADDFIEALHISGTIRAEQIKNALNPHLIALSAFLTTDGNHVYYNDQTFDSIGLDEALEDHIVAIMKNHTNPDELRGLVRFAERLYGNTDPDIRTQLVRWLKAQDWLTFTVDGELVGYRGAKYAADGIPESIHTGPAIVDGKSMNGHIPNRINTTVEMPRSMVEHDPAVGCASGLHVGTYNYAKGYAQNAILKVSVAPEDIVSVPFECSDQKIRCCKFKVLSCEDVSDCDWDSEQDRLYDDED